MRKTEKRSKTLDELKVYKCMDWEIVNYELEKTKELCKALHNECAYAYCYHDKDNKEPHCHLLLLFPFEKSGEQILELCSQYFVENVRINDISNRQRAYEYLVHKNDDDKWQYSNAERFTNNARAFKGMSENRVNSSRSIDKKPTTEEFIQDLTSGQLTRVELAKKYGRDYMRNMSKYDDFVRACAIDEESYSSLEYDLELQAYRVMHGSGVVLDETNSAYPPEYLNSQVFTLALSIAHKVIQERKEKEKKICM